MYKSEAFICSLDEYYFDIMAHNSDVDKRGKTDKQTVIMIRPTASNSEHCTHWYDEETAKLTAYLRLFMII